MAHSVYIVYPDDGDGWDVAREGGNQDFRFEDQNAALAHAFDMARTFGPAEVVLQDARGAIQRRWRFATDALNLLGPAAA